MDIPNASPFAASMQSENQDIPRPKGEAITPAPKKKWSKDDKNSPKMTAGGIVLDVINWGILGGAVNGALSIYMADKAGHGNWQPKINELTKKLQTKFPNLKHEVAQHRVMMGMLCSGGFAPLPIIKYIEDHKLDLTHKLDDMIYGKEKTEAQQEKIDNYYEYLHDVEAPQGWASVMGSRVVMLGTLIAVDELALKPNNYINQALTENNKANRTLKEYCILKEGVKYSWEGLTPKIYRFSDKMTEIIKEPVNIGDYISTKLEGTFLENNIGEFLKGRMKGEKTASFFTNFSNELDASARGIKLENKILNREYHQPKNGERLRDIVRANNVEWSLEGVTTAIAYVASRALAPIFAKGSRAEMGHDFSYDEKKEKQESLAKTGSAVVKTPQESKAIPSTKVTGGSYLTPEMMAKQNPETISL